MPPGWVDVEIFAQVVTQNVTEVFPGWTPPPGWAPPADWMSPGWMPPGWERPDDWIPPPWWLLAPNIRVEKSDAECVDAADGSGDFLCTNTITFTNTGAAPFVGVLDYTDTPPTEVVYETLEGAAGDGDPGWSCSGGNPVTCTSGGAVTLAPLGTNSEVMTVTTRVRAGFALTDFENCVELGPEHDGDPVGGNRDCAQAELPRHDLQVAKTNAGCNPLDGSPGWYLCTFNYEVTNVGHADYTGPLSFDDTMPAGSTAGAFGPHPDGITTAAWSCGPFAANPFTCNTGGVDVTLAPGQREGLSIPLWVQVSDGETAENCAALSTAAGGAHEGDPAGEIGADDPNGNNGDCATIDPPRPDLSIEKTGPAACGAGDICTYVITVTNEGPGGFSGIINITDLPSGLAPADFANSSTWDTWGWECTPAGDRIECNTENEAILNEGESASVQLNFNVPDSVPGDAIDNCCWLTEGEPTIDDSNLGEWPTFAQFDRWKRSLVRCRFAACDTKRLPQCRLSSSVRLAAAQTSQGTPSAPAASPPGNQQGTLRQDQNQKNNRSCIRTPITKRVAPAPAKPPARPQVALTCPKGWKTFERRAQVPSDWDRRRLRRDRQEVWCGKPRPVLPIACPPGWDAFLNPSRIPKSWERKQRQRGNRMVWCARPGLVVVPVGCRQGWKVFRDPARIPRGWQRTKRRSGNQVVWCARPGPDFERVTCPSGWKPFRNARRIPKGWERIQRRRGARTLWCGRPGKPAVVECVGGRIVAGRCICPPNTRRTRPVPGVVACKPIHPKAKSHPSKKSHPPVRSHPPKRSHPKAKSHPRRKSHPPRRSHPKAKSHPRRKSHPTRRSHPKARSHPRRKSHPPRRSHPRARSHPRRKSHPPRRSHPRARSHPRRKSHPRRRSHPRVRSLRRTVK